MRQTGIVIVLTVALLALAAPVLAGGWATVRLDEPPGDVVTGEPWQFGFTVLQHDVTPNSDVTPLVRALHKVTGEEVTATGTREGGAGHFEAELTLPRGGDWKWSIAPEPFAATSFETLVVVDERREADDAPQAAAPPASGKTMTVEIAEDAWTFLPGSLEAAAGTTVTWRNTSHIPHTVTGDDLAFDDSGLIDPGQSYSLTFTEPGTYHYQCAPHPGMAGVIVVS